MMYNTLILRQYLNGFNRIYLGNNNKHTHKCIFAPMSRLKPPQEENLELKWIWLLNMGLTLGLSGTFSVKENDYFPPY